MLKERLRFLLKDTALYGLASGFSRFVVFVTIPIVTTKLSVEEFGTWSLFTLLGGVVSAVLIFGMDSAVVRYYFDDNSEIYRRRTFSHGFFIQVFASLLFAAIALVVPNLFLGTVSIDSRYMNEAYILFSWIPANVLVQFIQNWFKWTFQRTRFLIIALGTAVANVTLLYAYLKFAELDLERILIVQSASSWIFVLLGIWWCRKNFMFVMDKQLTQALLKYGFPMMLVMLVGILAPALDRIFLIRHLSEYELGIYSFGQRLSMIMSVVVAAFQTAFGPFSFSIWEKSDARETFSKFQTYYIMAAGVAALGIVSCGNVLTLLLGTEQYLGSIKYLPLLVMGGFFYGMYSFAALGIFYSKNMLLNLASLALGLGVILLWNIFLVPIYHEYGAAAGFAAGNLVMIIAGYIFSAKHYKVDFNYGKDLALSAILFSMLLLVERIVNANVYLEAIFRIGVFVGGYILVSIAFLGRREKAVLLGRQVE